MLQLRHCVCDMGSSHGSCYSGIVSSWQVLTQFHSTKEKYDVQGRNLLELGALRKPAELRGGNVLRQKVAPERKCLGAVGCTVQHRCLLHLCSSHITLVGWPECAERMGWVALGVPRWGASEMGGDPEPGQRSAPAEPERGRADPSARQNPGKRAEEFTHPVQGAPCLIGDGTAQSSTREGQGSTLPAAKAPGCAHLYFAGGKTICKGNVRLHNKLVWLLPS